MTGPITRDRDIESLKTAARWPGADRNTTVVLAARLAAACADGAGYCYFSELAGARPGEALPLALAGFFQARLGDDADAALAKLDQRDSKWRLSGLTAIALTKGITVEWKDPS
jgi:hypothetical protein